MLKCRPYDAVPCPFSGNKAMREEFETRRVPAIIAYFMKVANCDVLMYVMEFLAPRLVTNNIYSDNYATQWSILTTLMRLEKTGHIFRTVVASSDFIWTRLTHCDWERRSSPRRMLDGKIDQWHLACRRLQMAPTTLFTTWWCTEVTEEVLRKVTSGEMLSPDEARVYDQQNIPHLFATVVDVSDMAPWERRHFFDKPDVVFIRFLDNRVVRFLSYSREYEDWEIDTSVKFTAAPVGMEIVTPTKIAPARFVTSNLRMLMWHEADPESALAMFATANEKLEWLQLHFDSNRGDPLVESMVALKLADTCSRGVVSLELRLTQHFVLNEAMTRDVRLRDGQMEALESVKLIVPHMTPDMQVLFGVILNASCVEIESDDVCPVVTIMMLGNAHRVASYQNSCITSLRIIAHDHSFYDLRGRLGWVDGMAQRWLEETSPLRNVQFVELSIMQGNIELGGACQAIARALPNVRRAIVATNIGLRQLPRFERCTDMTVRLEGGFTSVSGFANSLVLAGITESTLPSSITSLHIHGIVFASSPREWLDVVIQLSREVRLLTIMVAGMSVLVECRQYMSHGHYLASRAIGTQVTAGEVVRKLMAEKVPKTKKVVEFDMPACRDQIQLCLYDSDMGIDRTGVHEFMPVFPAPRQAHVVRLKNEFMPQYEVF